MKRRSRWVREGRVEDGRGSLGPVANAPFPIPAHRTGRADLRHPALRLDSPRGTRRRRTGRKRVLRQIFLLRLSTQQSRTGPVIDGVLRLIANHLDLPIFESAPEVRVLCSAGITQHRCSYDPVRLPPEPSPIATLRPLPSLTTGLPPITRTTFP